MTNILDDLFSDRFEVHNSSGVSPEYAACSKVLSPYLHQVQEALGKDFFDEMYTAFMDLCQLENRDFFQKGVQLGGQMVLAALGAF